MSQRGRTEAVQDPRRTAEAEESQVVPHDAAFRGHVRLRVPKLEAALLSGKAARQAIPGTLFPAPERCGNQLHVPAPGRAQHPHRLGGSHCAGLSLRAESEYADYSY